MACHDGGENGQGQPDGRDRIDLFHRSPSLTAGRPQTGVRRQKNPASRQGLHVQDLNPCRERIAAGVISPAMRRLRGGLHPQFRFYLNRLPQTPVKIERKHLPGLSIGGSSKVD